MRFVVQLQLDDSFGHADYLEDRAQLDAVLAHFEGLYMPKGAVQVSGDELATMTRAQLEEQILAAMHKTYAAKEAEYGEKTMRELERVILLRVVDEYWMDNIDAMTDLRQGIALRSYGQHNPVDVYKKEGYEMFEGVTNAIREETVRRLFSVRLKTDEEVKRQKVATVTGEGAGGSAKSIKRQPVRKTVKIGPNDPCPCGSGKKYKKCCRDKDLAQQ